LAVVALAGMCIAGCAQWRSERFNWNRYRDQRAQDIDTRLSETNSSVRNPFGTSDEQ
jgi:predicted Fe-S protein YdhL (DUF1289 family)